MSTRRVKRNLHTFFLADGVAFLVPYHVLYLFFCVSRLPTEPLTILFWILHFGFSLLGVGVLLAAARKKSIREIFFWIALAVLFAIPGAYLEFPSDTWEHLRRIFLFENMGASIESEYWYKAAYFFNWTLLHRIPIQWRWIGFDLLSAFWQLILAIQIYRFSRSLGFRKELSYIQVLAVFLLFGQNLFSLRYYALSTMPLSYSAYLGIATHMLNARERGTPFRPFYIGGLLLVIAFNHVQEMLLLAIFLVALYLSTWKSISLKSVGILLLLGIVFGANGGTWLKGAANFQRSLEGNFVTSFLTFRVWAKQFFESIGVIGLVTYAWAVLNVRKHRFYAILTLLPLAFLCYPPFVFIFLLSALPDTAYRLLYATPLCLFFVFAVDRLCAKLGGLRLVAVLLAVIGCSLPTNRYFRGKFLFQFYRVPEVLSLKRELPVFAQLREPDIKSMWNCLVFVDTPTAFSANAFLGMNRTDLVPFRLQPHYWDEKVLKVGLKKYLAGSCGIIVPRNREQSPTIFSRLGSISGHWDPKLADPAYRVSNETWQAVDELRASGWNETALGQSHILLRRMDR